MVLAAISIRVFARVHISIATLQIVLEFLALKVVRSCIVIDSYVGETLVHAL